MNHFDTLNLCMAKQGAALIKVNVAQQPCGKNDQQTQVKQYLSAGGEYEVGDKVLMTTPTDGVYASGEVVEVLGSHEIDFTHGVEYRFVIAKSPTKEAEAIISKCNELTRALAEVEVKKKMDEVFGELPEDVQALIAPTADVTE